MAMTRLTPEARQSARLCSAKARDWSTYPISAAGPPQHHCSFIRPNSKPAFCSTWAVARVFDVR